mgnify:CR=1 FL=1
MKATGAAKYTYDVNLMNQLIVRALGCPHAHCRIVSVDVKAAQAWIAKYFDSKARPTVVAQATEDIAVYRDMQRIFTLHTPSMLEPVAYSVRYSIDVERPDLPPEGPLPAPQRSGSIAVQ